MTSKRFLSYRNRKKLYSPNKNAKAWTLWQIKRSPATRRASALCIFSNAKSQHRDRYWLFRLVTQERFELPTPWFVVKCSIQLSYWAMWQGQRDSNPQPTVLETVALSIALCPYLFDGSHHPCDLYIITNLFGNCKGFLKNIFEKVGGFRGWGFNGVVAASLNPQPLNLLSLFCKQSRGNTPHGQSLKAGMSG